MRVIGYEKYHWKPHWRVEFTVGEEPVGILLRATMKKEKARNRAECMIYAYYTDIPLLPIKFRSMEMIEGSY